jgi:TatD DNase family protein
MISTWIPAFAGMTEAKNMYSYIDIHSHLNFPDYEKDFDDVIQRLKDTNTGTITVGTDLLSSQKAVELAQMHDNIYACIGLHPAGDTGEIFNEEEFEKLAIQKKVVAVGECGLDYGRVLPADERRLDADLRRLDADKIRQKIDFEKQINFATKFDLPLMLHVRNAHEGVLNILKEKKKEFGEKLRGNVHFFSGDKDIAKEYLDLGFTMSFTGVITFTKDYDEVIKFIPLLKIMSETDSPFVTPVPHRGQRNEPSYVQEVVKKIAEIRGEDFEMVKKTLSENAVRYFGLN